MLSSRQKKVLKFIVEEYVKTNEPVGSKTLTNYPEFSYSSATIRNDMAELEDLGLIVKTHTSSGRIPSEEGYRVYVKELLSEKDSYNDTFPMIDEIFSREEANREQAVRESMALVSDLTNYASVVLGSAAYNSRIKKLQIVQLNDRYAVLLMVTDQGYVESKKIIIPEDISKRNIEKVISLLNDLLYDCPISDIERTLKRKMQEKNLQDAMEYYDDLVGLFVKTFTNMAQDKYFLSGQSNILSQPEFQNVSKVKSLMEAIEKEEIFRVINLNSKGITVKIGQDNEVKAMTDCTVITVPYESDIGERGAIAVIGPTRMEYQKVIPLLDYIAKNLRKM